VLAACSERRLRQVADQVSATGDLGALAGLLPTDSSIIYSIVVKARVDLDKTA
jgi:hypothetical protein